MKTTTENIGYQHIPYKPLSSQQRRLLEKILIMQSKSEEEKGMVDFLETEIKNLQGKYSISYHRDSFNNLFLTKDEEPQQQTFFPLLVAHTDTVHEILPYSKDMKEGDKKKDFYTVYKYPSNNNKGYTYDSDTGIGGDDKNGIFILFSLLMNHNIPRLKVLFSVSEEIGGKGATFALTSNPSFFHNISYIIEPDRRGNRDIICKWGDGDSISPPFEDIAGPIWRDMGFHRENGSFTDSFLLFASLEISTFNISCGYYNPHSNGEYVVEHDIKRTMDTIYHLLRNIPLNIQWKKKHLVKPTGKKENKNICHFPVSQGNKTKKETENNTVFGMFHSSIDQRRYYGFYDNRTDHFIIYNFSMVDITSHFNQVEYALLMFTFLTEYADLFHERGIYDILTLTSDLCEIQNNLDLHINTKIKDRRMEDHYGDDD